MNSNETEKKDKSMQNTNAKTVIVRQFMQGAHTCRAAFVAA